MNLVRDLLSRLRRVPRKTVATFVFAVVWLNGVWFMSEVFPQGLIPERGYQEAGRAYVWSKNMAGYLEVTPVFYDWIRIHEVTFFVSGALLFLVWFRLYPPWQKRPRQSSPDGSKQSDDRLR